MTYNNYDSEESSVIFRDVITLSLIGVMALIIILLAHINPPGDKSNQDVTPPGNIIIEASWDPELNDDVDLWVLAPGDVPVGYSNKGGKVFNLLRDDLGHTNDIGKVNLETSYTRGIIPGEYIINLHLYRHKSGVLPIEVAVSARIKADANSSALNLVSKIVKLTKQGQELTVFRFKLTPDGKLVSGSINTIQRPLRSG